MRDNGSDATTLRARGGPGGLIVRAADLHRLAGLIGHEAEDLAREAWCSRSWCTDADLALSAPLSPATAAEAETAILHAAGAAVGVAADAARLGTSVAMAAWTYEHAEQAAEGLWLGFDDAVALRVGLLAPALVTWGATGGAACRHGRDVPGVSQGCAVASHSLESALTAHPWLVEHLVHGGSGLVAGLSLWAGPVAPLGWPGGRPPLNTQGASRGLQQLFVDGTPLVRGTGPRGGLGQSAWQADTGGVTGVGALMRSLHTTAEKPGGAIDIRRVTTSGPGGVTRTAYIVNIPGTDSWLPPPAQWHSRSAPDLGGNLRLVGNQPTVYSRGVVQAMVRAGVPRSAPVMLVGHSQGGMTAYQIAADQSRLRATGSRHGQAFNITHVITAGSPLATMTVPDGVRVLSLEASGDIVPDLDGAPNPDRAGHLTYSFERDRGDIGTNHGFDGYEGAAAGVDRLAARGAPGAAGFVDSLRLDGFLAADDGATVTTTGWEVSRAVS
ncbi:hypothetical protein [Oryzihumus leptocrescens]|uniref:PGAP1-like protein n=1 Tax=Oryzihumus leptocrescens TaxID=297536 RepID=A0A542ZMG1_9MICO|nr:hypothetical protein [Oryzihumus leptocrescens]TQL61531.1 hypothetical protein FB474_2942 [Oryzihumus leptocrescens]